MRARKHPFPFLRPLAAAMAALLMAAMAFPAASQSSSAGETVPGFADQPIGAAPRGFTPALTGGGGAVAWRIVEDAGAPGGRALAQVSADKTDYRFPVLLYDGANLRDVEVTVRFKPVAGSVDRAAGIVVRAADAENYYVLRANALEDNVNFYKVEQGRRREIKGTSVKVASGAWQILRLRAQGPRFEIFLDGRQLFTVEDKTFATAGRIGLWTKADSVTEFADLAIKPLAP